MKKLIDFFKALTYTKKIIICLVIAGILIFIGCESYWFNKNINNELSKSFLVQFDTRGGSAINSQDVLYEEYVTEPEKPAKIGYTFIEWQYNNKAFDFNTYKVYSDMILIAKWEVEKDTITVSVHFDTDGGNLIEDIELAKGSQLIAPPNPSKEGYEFNGWYLDDERFDFKTVITENITLVARWEEEKILNLSGNKQEYNNSDPIDNNNDSNNRGPIDNDDDSNNNSDSNASIDKESDDNNEDKSSITFSQISGLWYQEGTRDVTINFYIDSDGKYRYKTQHIDSDTLVVDRYGWNSGSAGFSLKELEEYLKLKVVNSNKMMISRDNLTIILVRTPALVKVNKIDINQGDITTIVGKTNIIVSADVYPAYANNTQLRWTSSDSSIVSVTYSDEPYLIGPEYLGYTGWLDAHKEGTAIITINSVDGGTSASFKVTVEKIAITEINLNKTSLELMKGNVFTLNATIIPSNASNKTISWSSNNTSVATVSSSGVVTAVGIGNATITATTSDGGYTATCLVKVDNPQLTASASIGYSTIVSNSSISAGISVKLNANGGSGSYTYYYIKLYNDTGLIGETTNTSSNSLFISGYKNGNYYIEYTVRDSNGNEISGTTGKTTISM